jgi:hypothetical protein
VLLEAIDITRSALLERILDIHFDPRGGTPYWRERERALGLDARREIRTVDDLPKLGPMNSQAMSARPFEDFVPRSLMSQRKSFIVAQTAGTLGRPKFAVHRDDEYRSAFIDPFVAVSKRVGFPRGENWLFVGPSGPHIIGRAARDCAAALDSPDPFTIDFDPRWAKRLAPSTFAWTRYLHHLEEQAMSILDTQRVGVLFTTPIVLESLSQRMSESQREAIRGLHLGGMSVAAEQRQRLAERFPAAVIVSGYGNTLFGMMPELAFDQRCGIDYFPLGRRLVVRVIATSDAAPEDRLWRDAAPGERGQVVVSRLDETQLIINMVERDSAELVQPPADAASGGFLTFGVRDPRPIVSQTIRPSTGIY